MLNALNDPGNTRNCFLRLDGRAAELHDDHGLTLIEKAFRNHELGIQYGSAGSPTDCVVAAGNEFHIEHGAFTKPAYSDRHAIFTGSIASRLRTVWLIDINDWLWRSAG